VAFNCLTGALPFASESAQEAMIMRLTDKPRTLAEVKPDVEWPASLQVIFDKVLARDAEERYQSAAVFGRELAAAIGELPLTRAMQAGTQMVGAAMATPGTVPQTKIGRASAKTEAMAAPAAPAKRPAPAAPPARAPEKAGSSKTLLFGGLGVAGAAVAAVLILKPFGGAAANGAANPVNASPGKVAAESTQANTPTPTGTEPKAPVNTPTNTSTRPIDTGKASEPNPAPSAMTRLTGWLTEVQAANATRTRARAIVGDIEQLRPTLAGLALAESWYVEMVAYSVIEDDTGACRAARQVKALHRDQSRITVADQILPSCS
jgi:hypothetical protein